MEDNFDFNKVGKRMPYKVPQGFFEKVTENTLAEAERRTATNKKPAVFLWRAISVAASLAILLTIGYFVYTGNTAGDKPIAAVKPKASQTIPADDSNKYGQPAGEAPAGAKTDPAPVVHDKPALATSPKSAGKAKGQPDQQKAKAAVPETLDEVLESMTDEELMLLAAVAETDLNMYEQTFENEQTY